MEDHHFHLNVTPLVIHDLLEPEWSKSSSGEPVFLALSYDSILCGWVDGGGAASSIHRNQSGCEIKQAMCVE